MMYSFTDGDQDEEAEACMDGEKEGRKETKIKSKTKKKFKSKFTSFGSKLKGKGKSKNKVCFERGSNYIIRRFFIIIIHT